MQLLRPPSASDQRCLDCGRARHQPAHAVSRHRHAAGAGRDHRRRAPGLGYLLRPGYTLPPLMFTVDELESLVLGTRWVIDRGDSRLAEAARDALSKIAAVLPGKLQHELNSSTLMIGPGAPIAAGDIELATIRRSIPMAIAAGCSCRTIGAEQARRSSGTPVADLTCPSPIGASTWQPANPSGRQAPARQKPHRRGNARIRKRRPASPHTISRPRRRRLLVALRRRLAGLTRTWSTTCMRPARDSTRADAWQPQRSQ